MPNTTSARTPSYRKHKATGQAVVTIDGQDHYLGKYRSAASRAAYDRLILQWLAAGRQLEAKPEGMKITELVARFNRWAKGYYRHADGSPTGEVQALKYALRPLRHLYGDTLVKDFRAASLRAVRELMIRGYHHLKYGPQRTCCRTLANARTKRIRRMFKWAVANDHVPAFVIQEHGQGPVSLLDALKSVEALKFGRTEARESKPVRPVARAVVEDTLPLLRPMQADMVRLMLESGMRPGELCAMRAVDIDMSGAVWLYRPSRHKTLHHGHERVIALGPRAQEIVRRHLTAKTLEYLFSPAKNMEERRQSMRANRNTKVQPSQQDRRKPHPRKKPGEAYTPVTWNRAITLAIKRHNAGKPESEHLPHWHLHQLRHLRALEEPGSSGKDSAQAAVRLLAGFPVATEKVTGSKEVRIEPFAAQAEAGNVRVLRAGWNETYIEEMSAFPNGINDDQCDATSGCFNQLAPRGGIPQFMVIPMTRNAPAPVDTSTCGFEGVVYLQPYQCFAAVLGNGKVVRELKSAAESGYVVNVAARRAGKPEPNQLHVEIDEERARELDAMVYDRFHDFGG
jgi:predicted phage terminase large subunit-like protein